MNNLLDRAAFAFFKDWVKNPLVSRANAWPNKDTSGIYHLQPPYISRKGNPSGRDYVVLKSADRTVLAVYRIRPYNGTLRRLFHYPLALNQEPARNNRFYKKVEEIT